MSIVLTAVTAVLTFAMFWLNRTMTKIAEDEKEERTGHSLTVVLPKAYETHKKDCLCLKNIVVVNNKNKTENVYRIFLKKNGKEFPFWHAVQTPLVIPPYDCRIVEDFSRKIVFQNLKEFQFFAVTSDKTVELEKNIDCYDKPLE